MNNQNIRKITAHATLTPKQAMKLMQHIATYGAEATNLDIFIDIYSENDINLKISVNKGYGVWLDVFEFDAVTTQNVQVAS